MSQFLFLYRGGERPSSPDEAQKIFRADRTFPGAADHGKTWAPPIYSAEHSETAFLTDELLGWLATEGEGRDEPWFVLTGHTLMVGDLGRTELASSAEDGARALFSSVLRLKELPDHIEVLPGAFSGSVCGRALSGKPTSTIGFERRFNRAFRIEDEAAFVAAMSAEIPPPPPDAARTRAINAGTAA